MPTKLLGAIVAASACLGADQTRRLTPQDFAPAETCKPCHTEIYQQWRASFHSQSAIDPVFWQMFQQALRDANIRASGLCLTCHAPVATVGMERSPVRPISLPLELSPIAREGVTCDFCHTISGEENLGKNVSLGAYRMPHKGETGVKYGTHPDATAPAHATRASAFLQSPQLCAICHGYTHPLPGLELQNTYAEWSYGPYRGQGRTCQSCHMPAYAGKAANEGPDRPDIHAHVFQGGHTEMLKKAAVVSLWARLSDKAGGNRIRVDALITNAGSGHLMPTGIPGIRQLWLELAVKAPGGAEVFTGRASFGAVLVDRDGNPAMPWTAVRVGSDTRIAPQRSRRETFEFQAPKASLEARARLYYRLVSEQAAKIAAIQPSPPIEVAADQILIQPDGRVAKIP